MAGGRSEDAVVGDDAGDDEGDPLASRASGGERAGEHATHRSERLPTSLLLRSSEWHYLDPNPNPNQTPSPSPSPSPSPNSTPSPDAVQVGAPDEAGIVQVDGEGVLK